MKRICRIAFLITWLLGICDRTSAQPDEIVRLRTSLGDLLLHRNIVPDTVYVDTLARLAYTFYGINADSAFFYGHQALDYAGRAGYRKGEAESWRILGNTYEMVGDYSNMLASYHKSLDIAERTGNKGQIGK